MTTIKTKQGVRYRLVYTYGSRWGFGKTHVEYYDRERKEWRVRCTDKWLHTTVEMEPTERGDCCKKCLPTIEAVFGPLSNSAPGK